MKRIGDILTRNKTQVEVEDGTSYKQVTIRTNYKGVVLRGSQDGATILTKNQFAVSAGQFILSRIDARNGAFGIIPEELEGAIVTNDFLAFNINEDEVEREFFNVFLQSPVFLEACIKASRGNTNRKRVEENFFLNYEINLPPLREQHTLIKQINEGRTNIATAQKEIEHQETLLAKLQQAILQEAIQGKLTADWRGAHPQAEPASQLLHRIQAEKARLIAAKQLRREKPLSKIVPAEIPFEIPKTWEWCWLGDLIALVSGQHIEAADYNEQKRGVPYLTGPSDFGAKHPTFTRWTVKPKVTAKRGDLLVTVKGSGVGKMNVLLDDGVAIGRQLMAVRPIIVHEEFIASFLHSQYDALQGAKEGQIPGIGRDDILKQLIPLPPLAEQAAIVARVEALLGSSRLLAAEIAHTRTHAAHLLQAVLKEAFTPAST